MTMSLFFRSVSQRSVLSTIRGISNRARLIPASATLKISALGRELIRQGKDIIDLGIGEPDMPPPKALLSAVSKYALAGHKVYGDIAGSPELINAIRDKLKRENNLAYSTSEIMGFDGGKNALDRIIETVINPDDEVIIPTPGWVSYAPQVLLAGGKIVPIYASIDQRFKITAEQLAAAMTPKTKLFISCPLSNPTGTAYTREELLTLASVLKQHPNVWIITDDIYEHLHFKADFVNILSVAPELKDRTLLMNGTTKSHTWRFGYVAGPAEVINFMKNIQSHRSGHPNFETQIGATIGLNLGPLPERRAIFEKRHAFLWPQLQEISGWKVIPGDGAFYFFVDISESMARLGIETDEEYCLRLLNDGHVAATGGSAFGAPGYLRLSYCQSEKRLEEALSRIETFIAKNSLTKTCA